VLVVLILVVEVLILQAYVNINRTTAIFGQQSFVTGALVNVQRETLLRNVKIEELPTSRDLRGAQVRRALLANQLNQLRAEAERMRPAIRSAIVRFKQLYDAKEQEFFGALRRR
jgi:hypothetical protein